MDFIRAWRDQAGEAASKAFVPMRFEVETFQLDWSQGGLVVGGMARHGIYDNMRTVVDKVSKFGDAKMKRTLLNRLTHHCHILKTGNVSYRFSLSSNEAKDRIKTSDQTAGKALGQNSIGTGGQY